LLKDFDWKRDTSPLAGFGGMSGVKRAHQTLLEYLKNKGCNEAEETLKIYGYIA
jgi:hypothetical protein